MSSSSTHSFTLNEIPKTPRASMGFHSKRPHGFANGETIVMATDYKRDQLKRITSILESDDLTPEIRIYWENRLLDVWKAPTQPPASY